MNQAIISVATFVLASSISYFNLSVGSNDTMLRPPPPPPAPPVAAVISDEEETVEGVSVDGDQTCLDCRR